jgi:hypothetical protein
MTSTNGAEKRPAANTSSPSPSPVPKKTATLPKDEVYVGSWLCEKGLSIFASTASITSLNIDRPVPRIY